jgi:thiamine biosynthesis lipoprotein
MRFLRVRPPRIVQRGFLAMGTWVTVTVAVQRQGESDAEDAVTDVERLLTTFGREAWAWGPGRLADFNRDLERGAVATVPDALLPLFSRAWEVREKSGGLYEPRIASLVRLWGFDDVARIRSAPPARTDIDSALHALHAAPGFDAGPAYGPAPGIGWDLGGIGKGWIVDQALDRLAVRTAHGATVDAGGNVAVRGTRGDRPWRIGIRDPRSTTDAPRLLARIDARDEAVITHADDQRFFEHEGQRYAHLLDPRTGWPVQGLRSLTVVHPDATLADAGGAAIFVAGLARGADVARKLGLDQLLAVTDDGVMMATKRLGERLQVRPGQYFGTWF